MRRFLLAFMCCLLLIFPVFATEQGTNMQITGILDRDSNCYMEVELILYLPTPTAQLALPLGPGAKNPVVNGTPVQIQDIGGVPGVLLNKEAGFSGTLSISMTYTLENCVTGDSKRILNIPLLAEGFAYPVDALQFQLTLPGPFEETPDFVSAYLGADVDNFMDLQIREGVITGTLKTPLRANEHLSMTLETTQEMFPKKVVTGQYAPTCNLLALLCAVIALVYWLIRLRYRPVRAVKQSQPPVDVPPGEIGCRLLAQSPDLALTIIHWAHLGYVSLHFAKDQDILLHKRMDMGNERSEYENRLFQRLFSQRPIVTCSSSFYQSFAKEISQSKPRIKGQFKRHSGNPIHVRFLSVTCAFFAGVSAADMVTPPMEGRMFPLLIWGVLWALCALMIHPGLKSLFSRNNKPGRAALVGVVGLVVLGVLSRAWAHTFFCLLFQCVVSVLIVFGGKRSEIGRMTLQSLLGFRSYLSSLSRTKLSEIMEQNPLFFYDMAPYALALGIDRQFATQFETLRLPPCPWLDSDIPQGNRAPEWYPILRQIAQILQGQPSLTTRMSSKFQSNNTNSN